jgi:hypothetical protein
MFKISLLKNYLAGGIDGGGAVSLAFFSARSVAGLV